MRETLRQLVELQRLDDELHRIAEAIAALPGDREAAQRSLAEGQQLLANAEARLEARQLELRQAETALQDAEELRKRLEGQQSQVKTNEAYTALLHEIDAAGEAISEAETRILEGMDATQEGTNALEQTRAEAQRIEQETRTRMAEIQGREDALAKEQQQIEEARAALAPQVDASALARYQRVAERKRPAVALVENEVCLGCRVGIPPQLHVEIIAGEDLVSCSSCKRILILPRSLE